MTNLKKIIVPKTWSIKVGSEFVPLWYTVANYCFFINFLIIYLIKFNLNIVIIALINWCLKKYTPELYILYSYLRVQFNQYCTAGVSTTRPGGQSLPFETFWLALWGI